MVFVFTVSPGVSNKDLLVATLSAGSGAGVSGAGVGWVVLNMDFVDGRAAVYDKGDVFVGVCCVSWWKLVDFGVSSADFANSSFSCIVASEILETLKMKFRYCLCCGPRR
ncbi:hypothetical protein L1987_60386 [Smallanthus sonchifolius]|uniref:Uncharacterized protein n=1 Tax=Smallanthus sonchifolius TaxID=185202 RepID=A0ACB9D8B1_9ASTR|nr:hypothetical protein L1987_60386 [Smallanthus sonchifolius]